MTCETAPRTSAASEHHRTERIADSPDADGACRPAANFAGLSAQGREWRPNPPIERIRGRVTRKQLGHVGRVEFASCVGLAPVSDQIELIVLTDEVDAEAVVRRFVDESKAGSKVKMSGGSKRIIGPQHQSAVSGGTREVDAFDDQSAAKPVATAVVVTSRIRSWAVSLSLRTQNTQPTRCPSISASQARSPLGS